MAEAYGVWGVVLRDEVGHEDREQMIHSFVCRAREFTVLPLHGVS